MMYINKNSAIETLQGLVEQSFNKTQSYMPESFSEKQHEALELFKQRIFLEEVIEESISFNKKINWSSTVETVNLIKSAEELIEVFKLRSDVYSAIGYQKEFNDYIEGLNFDMFDKNSAVLYTKKNNVYTGTLKVVFDSSSKLPSEDKFSFNNLRMESKSLVELSRFAIKNNDKALNQEFKHLFASVYYLYNENNIDVILSGIKKDHYNWYKKFGGVNIEDDMEDYGNLGNPSYIISWNPAEVSPFFKRAFLNIKNKL